jgi:cyclopropane-fatty-acyl-phospholipid synthase
MTKPSLARRLVLGELAKLSKGRLSLRLPEGTELTLGDPQAQAGARIEISDENAFRRIMLAADIGLTEGYMEGEWDSPDLNALIGFFIENIDQTPGMSGSARKAISEHYDVSNDFFRLFLDPSMMYSSARWEGTDSLEQAQANKNESLCRFLQLKPTDHVIEIGTGWGGWALHAVKKYGCRVTSLTISKAQHDLAVERIEAAGLSNRITVKLEDFRDHQGLYDKCVSIEMMEALGHKYLPAFCASIGRLLKPDGIAAFQYITCPDSRYAQFRDGVDFIQKHIFPGSLLLSINRVGDLMTSESGFQLDRIEEFGRDYARTLDAWCQAFEANLDKVRGMGFDERFIRKWRLYFRYCQAAFEHRNIGVVQAVYVRPNRKG